MKKFLLLWVVVCLIMVFLPKIIDKFTPKTIIKEIPIWRVKEVTKVVEKIVYKDREVTKEVISYKPIQEQIFLIEKIDEDTYTVMVNSDVWGNTLVDVQSDGKKLYFKKRKFSQSPYASMSVVNFQ